jgi:hypothetical protein
MKAYVVYWTVGDGEYIVDKAFLDRDKARAYIEDKNATTEYGWIHDELEVEE